MKRLAMLFVLVCAVLAYAGEPLGQGTYHLDGTGPGGGMIYVGGGGAWVFKLGIYYYWNGESGKYEAEPPSGDTFEFFIEGGSAWEWIDYPEPPDQGPPVFKSGGGVTLR